MSKGRLFVLEGLDGSGKATQAKLLAAHLAGSGRRVMEITFPDYESDSSALVKMYLSGQFGSRPDDVNPYAASSFYAVDRYASYKTKWGSFYEAGGIVIADRYTTSNAVHQCSKLPPDQWDGFLRWAFEYEYQLLGLPAPDAVVYLQVDPAGRTSTKRIPNIWPAAAAPPSTARSIWAGPPSTARRTGPCAPSRTFRPRCRRWPEMCSDNREKGRDTIDVSFDAAV